MSKRCPDCYSPMRELVLFTSRVMHCDRCEEYGKPEKKTDASEDTPEINWPDWDWYDPTAVDAAKWFTAQARTYARLGFIGPYSVMPYGNSAWQMVDCTGRWLGTHAGAIPMARTPAQPSSGSQANGSSSQPRHTPVNPMGGGYYGASLAPLQQYSQGPVLGGIY